MTDRNVLRYESEQKTDFQGAVTETGFAAVTNGTGAAAALKSTGTAGHPGVAEMSTGTTNAGYGALLAHATDWYLNTSGELVMEALVLAQDLSTVGEEYSAWVGFGDTGTTHDQVDGIYVYYDRLNDGVNFMCASANNSTRTEVDSGVAVVADTWYRVKIACTATAAYFYIAAADANGNVAEYGNAVATITTNLPSTSARAFGKTVGIVKTAGTTARTLECDYFYTKVHPLVVR